jgi:polysaccharide biosynthesis/export protein
MSPKGASREPHAQPSAPTRRWRKRLQLTTALAALALSGAGCVATAVSSPDAMPLRDFLARSRAQSAAAYRLRAGDQLTTRFFFNPQLDQNTVVRPDGKVALKLVGELQALGKSAGELSADITRAYAPLFNKSTAVVIVREMSSYRAFTSGELNNPGQLDLISGPRTVLESLAASGGVTEQGTLSHVYLIRRLPNQQYPMIADLNLKDALSGEDLTQDVELMPDDFVFVPTSGAANLNLALQQYFYRNLNFSMGVGVGVGFLPISGSRQNQAAGTRPANTPNTGARPTTPTMPMPTQPTPQPTQPTTPITPARP